MRIYSTVQLCSITSLWHSGQHVCRAIGRLQVRISLGFWLLSKSAHYEVDYSGKKTYLAGLQCTLTSSCAKTWNYIQDFSYNQKTSKTKSTLTVTEERKAKLSLGTIKWLYLSLVADILPPSRNTFLLSVKSTGPVLPQSLPSVYSITTQYAKANSSVFSSAKTID